jgi:pyruvate kinase
MRSLIDLRDKVDSEGRDRLEHWRPAIRRRRFLISALNLAHYLWFRRRDLREVQRGLAALGLSSLGRAESHIMPALDAVIASLGALATGHTINGRARPGPRSFFGAKPS